MTPVEKKCAKAFQTITRWRQKTCEMCPAPLSQFLPLEVHHILGKLLQFRFEPRAAIVLCNACHTYYQHANFLLLRDMRRPMFFERHRAQAAWLKNNEHAPILQRAWYDEDEELARLEGMLMRLKAGESRDQVRFGATP